MWLTRPLTQDLIRQAADEVRGMPLSTTHHSRQHSDTASPGMQAANAGAAGREPTVAYTAAMGAAAAACTVPGPCPAHRAEQQQQQQQPLGGCSLGALHHGHVHGGQLVPGAVLGAGPGAGSGDSYAVYEMVLDSAAHEVRFQIHSQQGQAHQRGRATVREVVSDYESSQDEGGGDDPDVTSLLKLLPKM